MVYSLEQLAELSQHERAVLMRRLMLLRQSDPMSDPSRARRRRLFLITLTGASAALIPWICFLGYTLPPHYTARDWPLSWIGFDILLLVTLATTCYLVWRKRQIAINAAVITGTLLICDAWFDMTLSAGRRDFVITVVTAVCGELPLAALMFTFAFRLSHLTARMAWEHFGHEEQMPRLWRLRMFDLARHLEASEDTEQ